MLPKWWLGISLLRCLEVDTLWPPDNVSPGPCPGRPLLSKVPGVSIWWRRVGVLSLPDFSTQVARVLQGQEPAGEAGDVDRGLGKGAGTSQGGQAEEQAGKHPGQEVRLQPGGSSGLSYMCKYDGDICRTYHFLRHNQANNAGTDFFCGCQYCAQQSTQRPVQLHSQIIIIELFASTFYTYERYKITSLRSFGLFTAT